MERITYYITYVQKKPPPTSHWYIRYVPICTYLTTEKEISETLKKKIEKERTKKKSRESISQYFNLELNK